VWAVGKKWSVYERRLEIMRVLESKRQETMSNFAFRFGVSIRTICYDVEALTASHPIETARGEGGCVKLTEGYRTYQNIFSEEQQETLIEIIPLINRRQAAVIKESPHNTIKLAFMI
jgi:predicted DNA-binding transcriptional regulator YafY